MNIVIMHKYWDYPIKKGTYIVYHYKWYGVVEGYRADSLPKDIIGQCFKDAAKEDIIVEVDTDV